MLDLSIKNSFRELNPCGQRLGIGSSKKHIRNQICVDYLLSLLQSGILEDPQDIGFCFWNISDGYALMRKSELLFQNHVQFNKHLKTMPKQYLYWTVNDATQKGTLEVGGNADFWWELYRFANEANREVVGCEEMAFEAHRAAMTPVAHDNSELNLIYARESFERFLLTTKGTTNHAYYNIIYQSLCLRTFGCCDGDLEKMCEEFYPKLGLQCLENDCVLGEWMYFVTSNNDPHRQARIAINSSINGLIYSGQTDIAKRIYAIAAQLGLPKNNYIKKRL